MDDRDNLLKCIEYARDILQPDGSYDDDIECWREFTDDALLMLNRILEGWRYVDDPYFGGLLEPPADYVAPQPTQRRRT